MYLAEKIIDKIENTQNDWRQGSLGGRSMKIDQKDYDNYGKTELVKEAMELEQMGFIKIKWITRGSDIEKVIYQLEDKEKFYGILSEEGGRPRISKQQRVWEYQKLLKVELTQIDKEWIRQYYQELMMQLDKGKIPKMLEKGELYFPTFRGLDELKEPLYKRIFSRKYLQNSKVFEREVQAHVISKAKEFCQDVEAEMNDTEVLSQLLIEEYSQELALKGPLKVRIQKDGTFSDVNLGEYFYGTVLNSETMKHAVILDEQPQIKRVVTIENKANFMSAPYQEDTLYIFTHGYFSPREKVFLQGLERVLKGQEAEFYHSGDLDYGGVKIYQYIKKSIFKELKPYMMDVKTYDTYITYGEPIAEVTLKKLQKTEILELQELINRMLEMKVGIEQESFLL